MNSWNVKMVRVNSRVVLVKLAYRHIFKSFCHIPGKWASLVSSFWLKGLIFPRCIHSLTQWPREPIYLPKMSSKHNHLLLWFKIILFLWILWDLNTWCYIKIIAWVVQDLQHNTSGVFTSVYVLHETQCVWYSVT